MVPGRAAGLSPQGVEEDPPPPADPEPSQSQALGQFSLIRDCG